MLNNLHRKALHALSQRESFHESEQHISEEYVALGALGQVLEPAAVNMMNGGGSPSSPSVGHGPNANGNGDDGGYVSYGTMNHTNHRGLPASSPTDIYHHQHHHQHHQHHLHGQAAAAGSRHALTHQNHAAHAAQWIQQQAYFPSRSSMDSNGNGGGGGGGSGQDMADTPSSNGTGYDITGMDGQADWQHGFMQSMGV